MKPYAQNPMTPKMLRALRLLQHGNALDHGDVPRVGRLTKQRLAKLGLAEYFREKDWDGPMLITNKGAIELDKRGR